MYMCVYICLCDDDARGYRVFLDIFKWFSSFEDFNGKRVSSDPHKFRVRFFGAPPG